MYEGASASPLSSTQNHLYHHGNLQKGNANNLQTLGSLSNQNSSITAMRGQKHKLHRLTTLQNAYNSSAPGPAIGKSSNTRSNSNSRSNSIPTKVQRRRDHSKASKNPIEFQASTSNYIKNSIQSSEAQVNL